MEESKQQQLMLRMQQQQQMQQRQQQLFMMQQLQKQQQQQQQQAAMSRFPSNIDPHFRPPGFMQNPPVDPSLQNPNPNLIQQSKNFQQQQQNVANQQIMMMMRQKQQQQQQQQQQKLMRPPSNQLEIQMAYQDAWCVCHPDFKRPFASLEDACERLLPYHVVADYEAEEDDKILDSDPTGQTLSRCQQWDNNIAAKVAEFTATFEKQVQAFNMITQKRSEGELRAEERLMIEQHLLQDERNGYMELKSEQDREKAAQEARLRMAAFAQAAGQQVRVAESQQSYNEMMARNPLRANAIGNHGEQQQGRNMNPEEMMMMMNGWGNNNNNSSKREDKEPLEDFLNDEENDNGEHDNWRRSGEFDLNTR
ncbi:hypothetical protein V5N11_023511 [Cardamine amara subsp. amara]|uniref:GLTSCR protein conserved domain-containing protein n=1 Tax=Cardamine amara subsp. amara TaxID=228776 RepID=A0ABD1BBI7_CARAN